MGNGDTDACSIHSVRCRELTGIAGRKTLGPSLPLWHTGLIVALVATASILGARGVTHAPVSASRANNLPSYLASIAMEWTLAGITFWGLHLRRTPLREVFGETAMDERPGGWLRDVAAATIFWIVSLIMLGSLANMLQHFHLHPENIRTTISKLAPYSVPELAAWTALSISAGICEEFIFRGYLQLQLTRVSHRLSIGAVASALVFGFSHGYEGLSGMLLIVAFGALFSVLRIVRGNLRAGIIAHAWHDFLSGMVLSFIAHHKNIPFGS